MRPLLANSCTKHTALGFLVAAHLAETIRWKSGAGRPNYLSSDYQLDISRMHQIQGKVQVEWQQETRMAHMPQKCSTALTSAGETFVVQLTLECASCLECS